MDMAVIGILLLALFLFLIYRYETTAKSGTLLWVALLFFLVVNLLGYILDCSIWHRMLPMGLMK